MGLCKMSLLSVNLTEGSATKKLGLYFIPGGL
jgi:hypothetical protein